VYRFQVHNAKLELSLQLYAHRHLSSLKNYLDYVQGNFPHDLFQNTVEQSSTFPAELDPVLSRKENHATRMAALVLPTAPISCRSATDTFTSSTANQMHAKKRTPTFN